MKLKITISSIILFLAAFSLAFAEGKKLEGEVTISGESITISGNRASLNEYRDLRDGFYGDVNLRYNSAGYFLNFEGTDIGRNTQNYRLDGGKWGQFKYFVDYDQIKHNFTFDARTFYTGVGTDRLTYTGVVPVGGAPAGTFTPSATIFDYASERKRLGAGFNLDLAKPFFLDVSVSQEEKKGLKPTAAGALTGGGYGLELPEPLDYRTDVLKLEMGYATKAFFASANLYYSEFRNGIEKLYHRNPAYTQTAASAVPDVITLPPDNSHYKFSLKGAAALPLNSRFNANLGFSKTKSEADLLNYISSIAAAGWTAITLSDPKFNGELDSQNYDFVLTSNPVSSLDAKVFYKYYKKSNKSDEITTTEGATSFKNHLFDYNKENIGASFGLKLPGHLKLTPAYSYLKVKRERGDFPENVDHTYSADLKWDGLDFLTAKLGYERLNRTGDWKQIILVTGTQSTANFVEPYVRRFDVAPMNRDTYQLSFDLYPTDNLNIGVGYRNKRTDFKDTILGIREDKSDEINFDIDYTVGSFAKFSAYYDYERTKSFQFQRRLNAGTITAAQGNPDGGVLTANFYNWNLEQSFTTDSFGFGADFFVVPKKLTMTFRYDSVKSDGLADYNLQWLLAGQTQDNIDISNWEDYRKQVFQAKAVYDATKSLAFTLGYAYERYEYSDALYDGYKYIATSSTGTVNNYLTGAYSNPPYDAHRVYAGVTYKF